MCVYCCVALLPLILNLVVLSHTENNKIKMSWYPNNSRLSLNEMGNEWEMSIEH